nr:immunoglobulin light chain junction region [Macaca mulatta]MOW56806.1 immunoglobulin light chain junction region [Macaca mulatta]MOW58475.1 immunoglobulin light chain junction region [Macaca mulatta]MOW58517.1 immunoglobulin light chain junction region [Macaca mulatta]MOW59324.1 immunoglobulin light chain junction region [Macaca mulatta]
DYYCQSFDSTFWVF